MELREITWENLWEILSIRVKDNQKTFVLDVSVFLAQAYVNIKNGFSDSCFGLYSHNVLVGFTKIVYVPPFEDVYYFTEPSYMIDALIIDEKHQNKGLGRQALIRIIDYANSQPFGPYKSIKLLCDEENSIAIELYRSMGFKSSEDKVRGKKIFSLDVYNRCL